MELSTDHRQVIILRHFHHLSHREIGDLLKVPEKTVKSRLYTGPATPWRNPAAARGQTDMIDERDEQLCRMNSTGLATREGIAAAAGPSRAERGGLGTTAGAGDDVSGPGGGSGRRKPRWTWRKA